jgi:hypothetical protein
LNQRLKSTVRSALRGIAVAAACLWGSQVWALGLGRLQLQSALGETLRAEIEGQWGGKAPEPERFLDLSFYNRALGHARP